MHATNRVGLTALTIFALAALSGCSLLGLGGPARDSSGRVTGASEIDSTTLLRGDCFSFVDGTNLARADVMPCSDPHDYIVIGDGTLSADEVEKGGGMQNAVSASCAPNFDAFKKRAPEGSKPEQQFIVSPQEKDGKQFTLYLCVATNTGSS
ncbi:hypothetical protein BH11ACT4_BH11ACT4_14700 [soil metagenome]